MTTFTASEEADHFVDSGVIADAGDAGMEISWDDADGEHDGTADPSTVEDLIGLLDGTDRTHVSIGDRDSHLVCGGSASVGLVLHVQLDGGTHQLLAAEPVPPGDVELVAAGQPGDYPARFVVGLARAQRAARTFVAESALDPTVTWERQ